MIKVDTVYSSAKKDGYRWKAIIRKCGKVSRRYWIQVYPDFSRDLDSSSKFGPYRLDAARRMIKLAVSNSHA